MLEGEGSSDAAAASLAARGSNRILESSGLEKITCKSIESGEWGPGEGAGGHPAWTCTWKGCGKAGITTGSPDLSRDPTNGLYCPLVVLSLLHPLPAWGSSLKGAGLPKSLGWDVPTCMESGIPKVSSAGLGAMLAAWAHTCPSLCLGRWQ